MMKDKRIQQLFDNYAEELPQQNNLCSRAAEVMARKAEQKKKSASFWKKLTGVLAASFVLVFFVGFVIGVVKPDSGNRDNANQTMPDESMQMRIYTASEAISYAVHKPTSTKLSGNLTAAQIIGTSQYNTEDGTAVSTARYFADYLDDGSLASVTAVWRVYVEQAFVDITVVAEAKGLLSSARQTAYRYFKRGLSRWRTTENGEEVTIGYLQAVDFRYYVSAVSCNDYASDVVVDNIVNDLLTKIV